MASTDKVEMSTELEAWLDQLGLGQYAAAFVAHAIDLDVVGDLTDADLVDLGVTPLGHRKRLLNAIAGVQRSRIDNYVVGLLPAAPAPRSRPKAERRQVSVLFCDLVGSTALAHRLDPEELAPITDRYHKSASETVRQLGGHVARFLGDGVMAYFGWPTSHEDDAERAVATGLELIDRVSRIPTVDDGHLAVRVGVATGLVAIGYGTKASDGGISGETPNVAARLQAEAEPDTLVVSPLTARLAGRSFRYKSLGKRALRGLEEPLEVLHVVGTRSSLNRFTALRDRSAAPLVGRSEEVELLLSRWRRTADGEGQIVLLSGDAGIGKSRLVQSTRDRIGTEAVVLRYQCSPLHQDTALFPIIQQLTRSFGPVEEQSAETKLAKARQWLEMGGLDVDEHLPLVCHLLQIKSPAHRLPDASPQQIRERLVRLLSTQFMTLTKVGRVLAIIEDVHWIDPTTENLFVDGVGGIEHSQVMVLATNRDAFSQRWHVAGYTTDLRLERLSGADSRRLIQTIAGDRLTQEVQSGIATRAEGVPLYLEELTLAMLEADRSGELGEVPTSLHALLAGRLDKMAEAKPLLQIGAVLGRQFTLTDLEAVAGCSTDDLRSMVERSLGSGLLLQAEPGNDSILMFKHALVQDAAYASLLNSEKRRLHAAVLDHLEQQDRSHGGGAALLASHAERGEVWDKAARYLIQSLSQAIRSSANHEAVALFDRTLKVLDHLPPDASTALAVDARLHAYSPLLALGEIDRVVAVMGEANALAHGLGDKRRLAAATSQLSGALWLAGKHEAGLQAVDQAVRLADELGEFVLRLSARFNRANLLHATGALSEAADLYTAIIDSLGGELELKRFGWAGIPSILSRGLLTWSLTSLGQFERARQTKDRAIELVDRIRDPYSTVYAYVGEGLYQSGIGHTQGAIVAFEAAHRITQQADIVLPIATAWLGGAYAQGGRPQEALVLLMDAERKGAYRSGGLYNAIHHYMALAQAHLAAGELPAAQMAIGRAQEIAEQAGELAHVASVFHIRGSIEAADPTSSVRAACACYQRAIDIGRPLGMRPLIAHSLAGMAEACEAAGDKAMARRHKEQARLLFDELGLSCA
jgi:class 3 adenylate cyclase/tetratricopeptide (TPR) repeat protein